MAANKLFYQIPVTSLPVNMRCTRAAVDNQYTLQSRGVQSFCGLRVFFALFVLTIAGKKIMSLQLTSCCCVIQFISKTKPEEEKCNEEKLTFHKLSFKSCQAMSRALCASLFAVLSNVEAVIKGKKVIVSLRVLTFSTFEGKKVLVSRVEVDHNGHVDAAEPVLDNKLSFKTEFGREPYSMPRFLPSYPMWRRLLG